MLPPPAAIDTRAFAADYAAARDGFRRAAQAAGARLDSAVHPLAGPAGEVLATDLAWLGPADAAAVLVTQSALHGVEGFAGSAAQADFLGFLAASQLPPGVAVLHVHAINPWGYAWLRRTNEDGVDLNRHFIDFDAPLPANPGYDELADALLPADGDAATLARADARLAAFRAAHGERAFDLAVTGGQYRHPQGLFYGGTRTGWSRRLVEDLPARYALASRACVAFVDLHTGLGPYGYGELICDHEPGSRGVALARRWYGPSVTEPLLGTSTSVPKHGLSDFFWHRLLGERTCFVTLEFGTFPLPAMFPVLRDDHRLHAAGPLDWHDPAVQQVKRALRDHFYPAEPGWQQAVLFRSRQVLLQALAGLAAEVAA